MTTAEDTSNKTVKVIKCDLLKFDKYEPMIKNCKKHVKKDINNRKNPNVKFMNKRIDNIYKILFDIDPTENKEYIGWIIKQINLGNVIMPEDGDKITSTLKTFSRLKLKKIVVGVDINQKTIHDIYNLIDSKIVKSSNDYSELVPNGCTVYYETTNYIKFKIDTPEAASKVAAGTRWCTSNISTAKSYVNSGLFVIYKKVDGKLEKLWQHNHDLTQVCDLQDKMVPDGSFDEEQCEILSLYDENGDFFYDLIKD